MCRIIEKWRNKQKLLTKVSVTAFWPLATFTQDSLVITPQPSSAQPSPGLRRRNFHTFSTFHSFYNNLTLTQTPHLRLYSGKMGTEIVFPPILTIFLYFDLIVLTRQIATFADAESPLFGSVQTFNGATPAPARGEKY